MTTTSVNPDQVYRIIENRHHNPFEVLGSHRVDDNGHAKWTIRAYLPDAEAAWVVRPQEQREYPMQSVHHPHFFECELEAEECKNYQLRVKQGDDEHTFYDPYAFKSPLFTEFDTHLFSEGNHHRIYEKMGAHPVEVDGIAGTYFAVWAPNARNASVLGTFNGWDGRHHQMRNLGSGIWELFIPALAAGALYKYEIKDPQGNIHLKSDPYGFQQEVRPNTASIVSDLAYEWQDEDWLAQRRHQDPQEQPISVYEVHLGSWLHDSFDNPPSQGQAVAVGGKYNTRFLTYRELADRLIPYVKDLGYTHIEVLPIAEHPFDGSWGYQVAGYFAPTSRFGSPQDLMYFVDQCHQNGIGVIVDWVPGHFPKDAHGLAAFDGSHLYEHADWRKGEHKGWGTLVFNYGRHEVRNFLIANALFWFDKYHIDGIRVDAVASMLYLDYDRKDGEWIPNRYGGNEHLEAADFLQQLHEVLFGYYPGVLAIAEESTAWANVSRPTYVGGLGFNFKWNMGWMHDMLNYFSQDPSHRRYHQNAVTFSILYAFSENFMLALSHDEVVHGKGSLFQKMPGDDWQKLANLRALCAYMFTHPGKKTLFMGMELAQTSEWQEGNDLDWSLLNHEPFQQFQQFIAALNHFYRSEPALYTQDFSDHGFEWVDCNDAENSVVSFLRKDKHSNDRVLTVCNFTPTVHHDYWVGVAEPGSYLECFNSDAAAYGGKGISNGERVKSHDWHHPRWPYALSLTLPPLGVMVFKLTAETPPTALE
jgi:1,4-alpha-glucan branching enzyme